MKLVLLSVLMLFFSVNVKAHSFPTSASIADLGRGSLNNGDFGALCVTGKMVEIPLPKKVVYSFEVIPKGRSLSKSLIKIEIKILNSRITIKNEYTRTVEYGERFLNVCGEKYVSGILKGVSISRTYEVENQYASKIIPLQVTSSDESMTRGFVDIVNERLNGIKIGLNRNVRVQGFLEGADFEDFSSPLLDFFTKYLDRISEQDKVQRIPISLEFSEYGK